MVLLIKLLVALCWVGQEGYAQNLEEALNNDHDNNINSDEAAGIQEMQQTPKAMEDTKCVSEQRLEEIMTMKFDQIKLVMEKMMNFNCSYAPCENGNCIYGGEHWFCQCQQGYEGYRCETDVNECDGLPLAYFDETTCLNGGTCTNTLGGYSCECQGGFKGDRCETDVNECETGESDCLNGGTCVNVLGTYKCSCPSTHTGDRCQHLKACSDYKTLTDNRLVTDSWSFDNNHCDKTAHGSLSPDWAGPAWYRFTGQAGTRLAFESEVSNTDSICGTHAPGFLLGGAGDLPGNEGQTVNATARFYYKRWDNEDNEEYDRQIKITHCAGYYVFFLPNTNGCHLRYCGAN